jgi:hypothetical protein
MLLAALSAACCSAMLWSFLHWLATCSASEWQSGVCRRSKFPAPTAASVQSPSGANTSSEREPRPRVGQARDVDASRDSTRSRETALAWQDQRASAPPTTTVAIDIWAGSSRPPTRPPVEGTLGCAAVSTRQLLTRRRQLCLGRKNIVAPARAMTRRLQFHRLRDLLEGERNPAGWQVGGIGMGLQFLFPEPASSVHVESVPGASVL